MKEEWKEYEYYLVSNMGRIYSMKSKQYLSTRLDDNGYLSVTMSIKGKRTRVRVHRLVGKLFVNNPLNLPELDHIDNDRTNAKADNLKWVTHKENIAHTFSLGNHISQNKDISGELNPMHKLTVEQVKIIREKYNSGVSRYKISKDFNISWTMVDDIVKYNNWVSVDNNSFH